MATATKEAAEVCRQRAQHERDLAERETLPRVREQYLKSALHWDQMAERIEWAMPGKRASLKTA